jgi:serine O-acetyltransferase
MSSPALPRTAAGGASPPFALVRRDLQRYFALNSRDGRPSLLEKIAIVAGSPGLHAVLVYRLGSWAGRRARFAPLRHALRIASFVLDHLVIALWGIHVDRDARIGPGLYIGHFGGVLIGPVTMGSDCNISHNVTLGRRAGGDPGVPALGDRVWIGVGSVLFGGIRVGDGTTIGPLTVVARNLPPRVLVMGNPMRLLRREYDNSADIYGPGGPPAGAAQP